MSKTSLQTKKKSQTTWRTVRLGDVASIQTGPFGSQLHQSDYVRYGVPIITVEHLGENRITNDGIPQVSEEDAGRLKKFSLKKGDVVFSRVGSVDRRAYVRETEEGWLFSGRCLRVRPHDGKADGEYLSYYFGQRSFKAFMRNIAVGATMPSLNTKLLSGISLLLPDLNNQIVVAEILSAFDEKIENNNRIIKTLEETAQMIFKEWFVRGIKSKSQKTKLGDVMKLVYGKALKEENRNGGDVVVVGSSGIVGKHNEAIASGPGIVVGRKGVAGSVIWVDEDFYPIDTTFYVKTELPLVFCYFLLKRANFISGDSAVPGLNREDAYRIEVELPDSKAMGEFQRIADSMFIRRHLLQNENQKLSAMRDLLLPRLMSGEIRV